MGAPKKAELVEQIAKLKAEKQALQQQLEAEKAKAAAKPTILGRLPAGFTKIEVGKQNLIMNMEGGATVRWGTRPDGKLYEKPYIKGAQFFPVMLRCASVLARMGHKDWAERFQTARELEKQNRFANQTTQSSPGDEAENYKSAAKSGLQFDNETDVPGHIDEPNL